MKKVLYITVTTLVLFLILEIILRLLGYSPVTFNQKITTSPELCYTTDSLGVSLKAGTYSMNINDCVTFNITHTKDKTRITSKKEITATDEIFIFGCSFAYGTGVNDQQTYPYLLQSLLPNYKVNNYSVPGSGTIQSYLYLKKKLEEGKRPKIVVLSYATFHEERNLLTRDFEAKLAAGITFQEGFKLSTFQYPQCSIVDHKVHVEYVDVVKNFYKIPFVNYSAIATFADQTWNNISHKKTRGFLVSELLFKDINTLAKKYNFKLIIADVSYNEKSKEIEEICFKNNLEYINISPDASKGNYSLAPCDFHPNAAAHNVFANKLYNYIKITQ